MMAFSEDGGEGHFLSLLASEKLSVMRGILLMVLYLLRWESDVEPRRLDLIWLKGPGGEFNGEVWKWLALCCKARAAMLY
jgi:hypothetical protein